MKFSTPEDDSTLHLTSRWRGLYLTGTVAAFLAVIVFRRYFDAELMMLGGFGILNVPAAAPDTAKEWFTLLHESPVLGLILLGLVDIINYVLVGLIFLALYKALRHIQPGAMLIAIVAGLVGIAVYIASNQAFALLNLSDRYAMATTDTQRAHLLASGEALLSIHHRGTGIQLGLILVLLAGLIISVVMRHGSVFSRWAAYAGILANSLGLAYFLALLIAPAYTWLPPTLAAPFRMVWYILAAIGLLRLARGAADNREGQSA